MRNLLAKDIRTAEYVSCYNKTPKCSVFSRSSGISLIADKMSFKEKSLNHQRKFNFVSGCRKGFSALDSMRVEKKMTGYSSGT